jgi:hypothetical protein
MLKGLNMPKKEIPLVSLFKSMADAVNHSPISELKEFPEKFVTTKPADGVIDILQIDENGICKKVPEDALAEAVVKFADKQLKGNALYAWDYERTLKFVKFWKLYTESIGQPQAVKWADGHEIAFHRMPWDFDGGNFSYGGSPTWDELFSRIDNAKALMEWIGSLFVEESYLQQYVWIVGGGGEGKGSLLRFLKKALGPAARGLQAPGRNGPSDHWTAGLTNIRLGIFPDNNNACFIKTGLFKSMSGGDSVEINPKHKAAYDASLRAKYIFGSNNDPQISSEESDMRRLILCRITAPRERSADFEQRLWDEGGHFLKNCIDAYNKRYGENHQPIEVDKGSAQALADTNEERYEGVINRYFVLHIDDPNMSSSEKPYVSAADFASALDKICTGRERHFGTDFRRYLKTKYGVFSQAVRIGGTVTKRYLNLELGAIPVTFQKQALRKMDELHKAITANHDVTDE